MELAKRSQRSLLPRWMSQDWPMFGRRPAFPDLPTWDELFEEAEGTIRVEEVAEDGRLVIRAELPGIDPDADVEITTSDDRLHIRAKREEKTEEQEKGRYRSEFRYGSFSRTLPMPAGATEDDIKATYEDGILEISVPVSEERAASRKIPIQRG